MSRRVQEINVIIHMPEDKESLDALQEKTNALFCHIVDKKFRNADLTSEERSYVISRIVEELKQQST